MPQFSKEINYVINYKNMAMGICIFTIGLFKKVVIADKFSPWVMDVFSSVETLTFFEAWIGALSYTFQLYFDFSGYSEMALGLGLMLNLKLPINFNSPYQATSIIDFWHRWHMTLGLWVRDYLYIPLGGSRCGELKKMRNLFSSMLIIGLWHGAGWTFIFWGALHGLLLVINHIWRRTNIVLPRIINWGLTFLCVVVCWVFFRAENFHDAIAVLRAMVDIGNVALPADSSWEIHLGFLREFGISFKPWDANFSNQVFYLFVTTLLLLHIPCPQHWLESFNPNIKWLVAIVIAFMYAVWHMNEYSEFLYFQF